ncbi:MAG TPA: nucleotide disphospho-sugar-binding domain-containing protein [Allosphingosinicella sp.]|nr:nucleotide disphospho-sugar-binding domain-containing protein [Allosphingosinicella sp.]
MAHFALIAPPLTGHLKPMAALAGELKRRGHRATFLHEAGAAPLAASLGLDFVPLAPRGPGSVGGWTGTMARTLGLSGIGGTIGAMARQTELLCREGPQAVRAIGADAILADQLEAAGGLLAEHLRLPFATISSALPINREPGVPPPYLDWPYDPSEKGLKRNRGGWRIADLLMRRIGATIARESKRLGLPPRRRLEDCFSPLLQVAQAVPGIDFPRRDLPASFHYLGPFRRSSADDEVELPDSNGRPLVYCSFGTLQGSRLHLFERVARACAELDLRLVLTHCGRLTDAQAARLPGTPFVRDFLPQEAVLRRVDLVVTHAGFNTVIESLAEGLAMVALPLAFDQPAVGARIAYAGVGQAVKPRQASVRRLREAMETVLGDPSYRARSGLIRREIETAGGIGRAADLIEARLG